MRQKIKRVSKSTLAVVLTLLMVMSTTLIGTVSVNAATTYYYRGDKNSWGATAMTASTDGYYAYYGPTSGTTQFKIAKSSTSWDYNYSYVSKGFNNTDVQDIGDYGQDNAYVWKSSGNYYILIYYPNTDINTSSKPKICASTFLPNDKPVQPAATNVGISGDSAVHTGDTVTYNVTATPAAGASLKYTYYVDGTKQEGPTTSTSFAYTHATTGNKTIKVVVSADGFSDVEASCTTTVSDPFALVGTFNGWDKTANVFTDGTTTIELPAGKTYEFKVRQGNDYYGNNGTINDSVSGWTFTTAEDNCKINTGDPGIYTFTFDENTKKLSVTYPVATRHTVTAGACENGTVKVNGGASASVLDEGTVELSATANEGYEFVSWNTVPGLVIDSTTSATTTATVTGDATVTANFIKSTYAVNVDSGISGGVVYVDKASAHMGDTITVTTSPSPGYQLKNIVVTKSSGGTVEVTDGVFTMPADSVTVSAVFEKASYSITYTKSEGVKTLTGKTSANLGDTVTVTAEPEAGYEITGVYVDSEAISDNQFTMPEKNVEVTATASKVDYTVTVNDSNNIISVDKTTANYNDTINVTVNTANVPDGYEYFGFNVDSTFYGADATSFNMPANNVTVTPVLKSKEVQAPVVTLNGSTTDTSTTAYVKSNVNFTASANVAESFAEIETERMTLKKNGVDVEVESYITQNPLTGYTFRTDDAGTYIVSYYAKSVSKVDPEETAEKTVNFTITVEYSQNQNEYNTLKSYVADLKYGKESDYSSGWPEFKAALDAAQAAIDAGLPTPDDTTYDYAQLKSELETAYGNLVSNQSTIYLRNDAGWSTPYAYVWQNGGSTKGEWPGDPMTYDSITGLYKYTFEAEFDRVIFSNNGSSQKPSSGGFVVVNGGVYSNGTSSGQEDWYIIGHQFGNNWDRTCTDYPLTYDPQTGYYYIEADFTDVTGDNFFRFHNKNNEYSPTADTEIYANGERLRVYKDNTKAFNYQGPKTAIKIWFDPINLNAWVVPGTVYHINKIGEGYAIDKEDAPEGDTVTLEVTTSGKAFDTVTVTTTAGDTIDVTVKSGVATFKMPDSDVTVNATLRDLSTYNINATSSDPDLGSVSVAPVAVTEGESTTLTATATAGVFNGWSIDGEYEIKSGSLSSPEIEIIPSSNISAVANFGTASYKVYLHGRTIEMTSSASKPNVFVSTETIDKTWIFKIRKEDASGTSYSFKSSGNSYWLNSDSKVKIDKWNNDDSLDNNHGTFYDNYDNQVYVFYDSANDNIWLSKTPYTDAVKVYAKYGTSANNGDNTDWYKNSTHVFGVTTAEASGSSVCNLISTKANEYNLYSSKVGSTITLTTTMNSGYRDTHYVYGYVVNGTTFAKASPSTTGVYTADLTITENLGDELEVTPIYYVNDIDLVNDPSGEKYIRFEVIPDDDRSWGNTISSYAYYYTGSGIDALRPDGAYPGQPMIYDSSTGRYYTYVPKVMVKDGHEYPASGMTISNYNNDKLYSQFNTSSTGNHQSYDYDDFKIISEHGYNLAVFDMKPRHNIFNEDVKTFNKDAYKNGWDDFVNYDQKLTDPNGHFVDETVNHTLYVISNGNKNTGIGQWSVKWYVVNENGQQIAEGAPSDFIPSPIEGEIEPKVKIPDEYKGARTYITFDGERTYSDGAKRLDGRWYYETLSSGLDVHVKAMIRDAQGHLVDVGTTGCDAVFTENNEHDIHLAIRGQEVNMTAIPSGKYIIREWGYINDKGEYVTSTTSASLNYSANPTSEITFVAVFEEAEEGFINLSHSKYTGPDAFGGNGSYFITAIVTHKDGSKTTYTDLATAQSILVTEDDKNVEITLTTRMAGVNQFVYWYAKTDEGYEIIDDPDGIRTHNGELVPEGTEMRGMTGEVTYTFEANPKKLLKNSAYYFYSDIAPQTREAKLIYKYLNRFDVEREYVVIAQLEDKDYDPETKTWYVPDELIQEKAPAIDEIHKDCKWIIDEASRDGTVVTLVADQSPRTYTVDYTYINADGDEEYGSISKLAYNSLVTNSKGEYLITTADKHEGRAFSYWSVLDAKTQLEIVRGYNVKFMLRVTDDYILVPVYGAPESEPFIGAATYTREQFTDPEGKVLEDYVYVDFIVSYSSKDGILLRSTTTDEYQTGVVLEISKSTTISEADKERTSPMTDYSAYEFDSDTDPISNFVLGVGPNKYTKDGDQRGLLNYTIDDNSLYSNKNVLDYYVRFKASATYKTYVMKAYYYVIHEVDGEKIVELSDPVYFNYYYAATKMDPIIK